MWGKITANAYIYKTGRSDMGGRGRNPGLPDLGAKLDSTLGTPIHK